MHRSALASVLLLSLFPLALPVRAQQVGDKVVVISDSVEIKVRQDVIDTTRAGAIFIVRAVQGDRIGINSEHGTGFIENRHVIPLSRAVSHWSELIRSDPENSVAFIGRGLAHRELREYDKAITDYTEALRLDRKSVAAFLDRGSVWLKKREFDKAIADYTEAIRLDPKYAGAYSNRGAAWQSKGDHDKAIANYNEAIRLDPKDAVAYYNRGHAWQSKRDLDQAIADYSKALQLDPQFASAYFNRGQASASQDRYEDALADYNEAIRLEPQYARPYDGRAWIWATCPDAKCRDGKRAVGSALRACELDARNGRSNVATLAAAYAEAGDFENAVKWQTRAVELASAADKPALQTRLELFRSGKPFREEPKK
ncbi:MAG: tetratricopeptide repeat protein [Planctomycetaceae bacterium]